MRTELALFILSATILVALTRLQWQRLAPLRQPVPGRRPGAAGEERRRPPAGSGLAGRIAWLGLAAATLACLGHLVAPVADPLWLALLAAAVASIPAALAAPSLQARRQRHRWQREGDPLR